MPRGVPSATPPPLRPNRRELMVFFFVPVEGGWGFFLRTYRRRLRGSFFVHVKGGYGLFSSSPLEGGWGVFLCSSTPTQKAEIYPHVPPWDTEGVIFQPPLTPPCEGGESKTRCLWGFCAPLGTDGAALRILYLGPRASEEVFPREAWKT